jgi:PAS domain S-box-containing protein
MSEEFDMAPTRGSNTSGATRLTAPRDQKALLIWGAHADGRLDYFNDYVHKFTGAARKQLSGSRWLRLVHPDDRRLVLRRWIYSVATHAPYECELRIRKHDHSYHWFLMQVRPTPSSDAGCLRWLGTCTELKSDDGSLPAADMATDCLHRIVHDAAWNSCLHQQLGRDVDIAKANEGSDAIAHMLNQPLTAVLGNAQALQAMLNGTATLSELQETVADIVTEVRRAIQMLRNWRVACRGSALQLSLVRINGVVRDAGALLLDDLIANRCVLQLQLARHSPRVRIDTAQMQYALAVLIMNACETMTDVSGEGRRIRVRTLQPSSQRVQIEVVHGKASLQSDALEMLEPLQSTKPHHAPGLGLSICKKIVAAHDGRLEFLADPAHHRAGVRVELPVAS